MKTKLLILSALSTIAISSVSAQITLSSSGYPATASIIGYDSLSGTAAGSAYPSFVPATNATWDMNVVTYDGNQYYTIYTNPDTSAAQFADSEAYSFSGYDYVGDNQNAIFTSGYVSYGLFVSPAGYSLTAVTGGGNDSLWIEAQHIVYSTPDTIIAMPATYNTNWSSSYNYGFNMMITAQALTYNHAPAFAKSYATEKDTVVGWGQMRVKNASGNPSGYMNVLQVKKVTAIEDSFYINSAVPASLVLNALGITEGQVTKSYTEDFYRAGEVTPLASITFTDSTYSTPSSAKVHDQRLTPSIVGNVTNINDITVYPNPVTTNIVSVTLPSQQGAWTYDIINVTGATVTTAILNNNNSKNAAIELPATLNSGIYYIRMFNNGKQISVKPIDVIK